MKYHALVPVKSLDDAKSRLKQSLSSEERKELVLRMLDHVLAILHANEGIAQISVVTPDSIVREHALSFKATVLQEEKTGYNPALSAAARHEKMKGVRNLLTIAADLPLLTPSDITQLIKLSSLHDIVLAPSKDNGTNSVLMHTPLVVPYLFGKNSFDKYKKIASEKNLTVGIYQSKTLGFDVDTAEDLYVLEQMEKIKY